MKNLPEWKQHAISIALALTIGAAVVFGSVAAAKGAEKKPDLNEVVSYLYKTYGEQAIKAGVLSNGHVLVLFYDPKDDSFTMVTVDPQTFEVSKLAAGEAWEDFTLLLPPTGREV